VEKGAVEFGVHPAAGGGRWDAAAGSRARVHCMRLRVGVGVVFGSVPTERGHGRLMSTAVSVRLACVSCRDESENSVAREPRHTTLKIAVDEKRLNLGEI
jgi:hypothetical protein